MAPTWHSIEMRVGLVAHRPTPTNEALVRAHPSWELMSPKRALAELRAGDVAIGRLDVLRTLDGVEDWLWALGALAARGVTVLNEPATLLAAHDKLLTARLLRRHGIRHPKTWHVRDGRPLPRVGRPVVLKPRFGSWGREVVLCDDSSELEAAVSRVQEESWYRRHGALVQELVSPRGYDLRIVVAAGCVVGAAFRIAAPGEWRTNVALGAVRRPARTVPPEAAELAVAAASAVGAAFVGVDLLPALDGWAVAEVNGAVEFTTDYADWHDVFAETASVLTRAAAARRASFLNDGLANRDSHRLRRLPHDSSVA